MDSRLGRCDLAKGLTTSYLQIAGRLDVDGGGGRKERR